MTRPSELIGDVVGAEDAGGETDEGDENEENRVELVDEKIGSRIAPSQSRRGKAAEAG